MVAFACGACGYSWQRPETAEERRKATARPPAAAKRSSPSVPLRRKESGKESRKENSPEE
jgi:hypothetical protein